MLGSQERSRRGCIGGTVRAVVSNDHCPSNRRIGFDEENLLNALERQHVAEATSVSDVLLPHEHEQLAICAKIFE